MTKKISNVELKRVNINLPLDLVERVRTYADCLGINSTSAYIVLLNQALDQREQMKYLPIVQKMYDDFMSSPQLKELLISSNSSKED